MSPEHDPIFDRFAGEAPHQDSIATRTDLERLKAMRDDLEKLLSRERDRKRTDRFLPYLLVRSTPGDRGTRPINVCFWESPDIWTAVGDPASTPAIPASSGGVAVAGVPNTVYAHVWNLGRAPLMGVRVEFYWFNPSLGIQASSAHLIGVTSVDLGARSQGSCHRLVKCPVAWVPVTLNGGHECLVVRISGLGEPPDAVHSWDSWADRKVAQRNISVVAAGAGAGLLNIMTSLNEHRFEGSVIRLHQVGLEARNVLSMTVPDLKLDPGVTTHLLAELTPQGTLSLPPASGRRMLDQRNDLSLQPVTVPSGIRIAPFAVPRIDTGLLTRGAAVSLNPQPLPPAEATFHTPFDPGRFTLPGVSDVGRMMLHTDLVNADLARQMVLLAPPRRDQAQVLRVGAYQGDQLVGGYTVVIQGAG